MKFLGLGLLCLLGAPAWADLEPFPTLTYQYGNYLLSVVNKLNWYEATAACARYGYSLASIPSQRAQTRIYYAILSSGFQKILTEPVWTSGSNQANGVQWSWSSTGNTITYRNFAEAPYSYVYNCLALDAVSGLWSDINCTEKRYFVCEKRCA
ncbi:macrophage mannose receptor 1 [Drosophila sulfurigaster albostrigata]|uniref:macrophage mannose receptor 1 n=1 Tax=Drosophila sulfurigaster albostrigata TaxID=89887 RepID=UPI002D21910C|nr:macrophage mannose receptor 1 [Drosophila sulfurigaster albostrigata]